MKINQAPALVLLLIIFALACGKGEKPTPGQENAAAERQAAIRRLQNPAELTALGKVVPSEEVLELAFEVSGRVQHIYYKEGQQVRANDLLIALDAALEDNQMKALGAQFFSPSPDLYNFKRWYGLSYIGLTASLPIYDGNDRRYGAQIENLKMEQVRNQMQAYRIEQENKTVRASLQLESARAQALLARQAIQTAEQNLMLARVNYQNEVTGFQPVFDALQALSNSRGQLINAKASYVQALLEARLLDL